jgi:hypothetical protein
MGRAEPGVNGGRREVRFIGPRHRPARAPRRGRLPLVLLRGRAQGSFPGGKAGMVIALILGNWPAADGPASSAAKRLAEPGNAVSLPGAADNVKEAL